MQITEINKAGEEDEITVAPLFKEEELALLIERLEGEEWKIAHKAFLEIRRLKEELRTEKEHVMKTTAFLSSWAEGFERIVKTPVNLENHELLRIRYSSLRDSARNLVDSCRKKVASFNFSSADKK